MQELRKGVQPQAKSLQTQEVPVWPTSPVQVSILHSPDSSQGYHEEVSTKAVEFHGYVAKMLPSPQNLQKQFAKFAERRHFPTVLLANNPPPIEN